MDIPQLLIEGDWTGTEPAELTGVPWERLRLIMAVLRELDIASEDGIEIYRLTGLTELLGREKGHLYGQALMSADMYYRAWTGLDYSLKSGESAFINIFGRSM